MGWGRKSWIRYRVGIYAVVVVLVFVYRNHFDWRRLVATGNRDDTGASTLIIAGSDLAPALVDALVEHYGRDYPDLDIRTTGGGTNQALEDLLNRQADVALLARRPTPAEQQLFRQVDGDTAIVVPIGLGGVVVLAGDAALTADAARLTTAQLAGLLAGDTQDLGERFYAADPNLGYWAAAARALGVPTDPVDTATVVYLADDHSVAQAVANDPRSLGMIVSYDLPVVAPPRLPVGGDGATGPRTVPLAGTAGGAPVAATYENVAAGTYPLHVPLLVACRGNGSIQGAKFVTHLASGPGQRQVERAGCVPAVQVLREIILTTDPPTGK